MSQEKGVPPASAGQAENIFNLYGYHPQFAVNTLVADQQHKDGPGGQVYRPTPLTSTAMHHPHPVQSSQQQHHGGSGPGAGLGAGSSSSKPLAGAGFTHGIHSAAVSGSTPNPSSVAYIAGAAHPASASAVQKVHGSDSVNLSAANQPQTEQFRPHVSSAQSQVGVSAASGSVPASSPLFLQQGVPLSVAADVSAMASLPVHTTLIQQGLLANPLYSQGSVSSVVGAVPHTHAPPSLSMPASGPSGTAHGVPQLGRVLPSSSAVPASLPGHSHPEGGGGGKRKASSPGRDEDCLQYVSKQPRAATATVWGAGKSSDDVSVPPTTTPLLTLSAAPHASNTTTSLGGQTGDGHAMSKFMDSFRSFVGSAGHSAASQQSSSEGHLAKYSAPGHPGSASSNREGVCHGMVSHSTAGSSSGVSKDRRSGGGYLELKKEPAQPQSQSFVEKMHATIFSLGEEASPSASGAGGQPLSLVMSGGSLASILKKVGRLDGGSQDPRADSSLQSVSGKVAECPASLTADALNQGWRSLPGTSGMDSKKSSPSPPLQPSPDVKSEAATSDMATDDDLSRPSVSDGTSSSAHHQHDQSSSTASDSESEIPSTSTSNSKKRTKDLGADAASNKIKKEIEKSKPLPLTSSNPCVSGKRNKKQGKNTKQTPKGGAWDKPLVKVSMATLKRTGAHFLQNGPCTNLPYKVSKCSECRLAFNQGNSDMPSIFCRFYAFRRLKYHPIKGTIMKAGFSELSDADPDHIEPWLPRFPIEDPQLDKGMAKFILSKVGDKFCELVQQEKEAKALPGADATVVWKRAVTGVREMCDVCETTIFNMHWVCSKCGYVVCLDCYKAKVRVIDGDGKGEAPPRKWQICSSSRYPHDASKLMLTQIIPSDALWELGRMIHDIRRKWSIPATCPCGQKGADPTSPVKADSTKCTAKKLLNGMGEDGSSTKPKTAAGLLPVKKDPEDSRDAKSSSNTHLQDIGVKRDRGVKEEGGGSGKLGGCTSLRELLTKTAGKGRGVVEKRAKPRPGGGGGSSLNDIIQSVVERSCRDLDGPGHSFKFLHYTPRLGQWRRELPVVAHSLTETSVLYPDVPHSWLCDGRLLRLHDPHHKGNLRIFQEQWKRGQPVMVSSVHKLVKAEQWRPEAFSQQFGDKINDLVNCHNGDVISDHPMRDFWDGFESIDNRLVDGRGRDLMLKLKDWPPGDDFAELLPSHFDDLMAALPLPEYTRRDGKLNLASRLPTFLVRPDLGPKMYNAFGSAKFPRIATTNLHLDISDAVNVLVYVGVPADGTHGKGEHEEAAVKAIDEAGCDSITKRRVREVHELPGALWQIYDAHDADKIRDFLNKVAKERGEEIEPNHDAIHDQSWYLNEELRDRLLKEYGVQGYTIVQCLGDSIFIPAGAPHQVRNLHSCIKVAEDFVSPEHLNHCFRLTQEFRQLSDTHTNHEDKLQVKNIIYHAVKDSIAVLRELEPEEDD